MDDKTVIICAATLCVLGFSLGQTLGSGAGVRTAHSPAGVVSAMPAVIGGLDAYDPSALRPLRAFSPAN